MTDKIVWSTDKVELLKKMADQGRKGQDVAKILKCSRSAVLGKAMRLGVKFDGRRIAMVKK